MHSSKSEDSDLPHRGPQLTGDQRPMGKSVTEGGNQIPLDTVPNAQVLKPQFTRGQLAILLVLASLQFTHILDFVIVMPLGDRLRGQLHILPSQFSVIVSAYGIAATVAGIAFASFVDRFDRKHVLVWSFGFFTLATFYCGFASDYVHLIVARALTGIFGGIAASTVMAVIGDVFPDQLRGKAIGLVTSSFAVASVIGLPIGLSIANHFDTWSSPFLAIGALALVVWGLAIVMLPTMTGHRSAERRNPFRNFADVVRHPNHLWAFAMMFATILGTFTIVPFIAPYLQSNGGRSPSDLPIIYAVSGACTFLWLNVIGWATDKIGPKKIFVSCAAGAIVMTIAITHLGKISLWGAVGITALFMVLASGRNVPAQAMMLRASDPKLRGAFMNLNSAVTHLATAVGPMIAGSIIGEEFAGGPLTHFSTAGFVAAGFGATAIILSTFLKPFHPLSV